MHYIREIFVANLVFENGQRQNLKINQSGFTTPEKFI